MAENWQIFINILQQYFVTNFHLLFPLAKFAQDIF